MDTLPATRNAGILLIIAASIAMFMASLDGTIVNIALPTIAEYFHIPTSTVSWVATIYMLVSAGLILVVGKLSDTLGYKRLFLLGFIIFTFGSFFCGFFPEICDSFPLLLVGRVIQAVGCVQMMVISPTLITTNLPSEKHGKGIAAVMLFASVGMALGPTLGGLITQFISWHWIFFINVPVGIIAVIFGLFVIPKDTKKESSLKGFDGIGAALIFVGLAGLLFAISEGSVFGWTSLPILLSFALALIGIGGFILRERKVKSPILDLSLFKNKAFLLLNIIFFLHFFVFAGVNYLLPFFLQYVKDIPTFASGLIMTVMSIGIMITGILGGVLYQKFLSREKILIISGVVLIALGFFFLTRLNPVGHMGFVVAGLLTIGLGLGLNTAVITALILGSVSSDKQGMASSLTGIERMAPITIGIAAFNLIFVSAARYLLRNETIISSPLSSSVLSDLTVGFDFCFMIALGISLIILVLCFFFKEKNLNSGSGK
ncbi:MAG TPA: DHA2 family efflux MFS transporter permease subunit [Methanocorpusculum sp.]|nr:DHA2 family efflux MFS transporter permease subunit [Methanocorpusculum sp.]